MQERVRAGWACIFRVGAGAGLTSAVRDVTRLSFPLTGLRSGGLQDPGAVVGARGWVGEGRVAAVSPWCGTQSWGISTLASDMPRALAGLVGCCGLEGSNALQEQILPSVKDPAYAWLDPACAPKSCWMASRQHLGVEV